MVVAIRIGIRQRGTAHVGGAAGMRKAGARKRGKMLDLPQGAATGDVAEYERYQMIPSVLLLSVRLFRAMLRVDGKQGCARHEVTQLREICYLT